MKGKENATGEDPADGDNRLPVAPPEIGPADHPNIIDFNDDDEFVIVDIEDIDSSDEEMPQLQIVPYQAVQFLVAATEEEIVETLGFESGDEDADQEPAAQPDEVGAPGNLPEAMDVHTEEEAQPADVKASANENQQPMEAVAGIGNEPEGGDAEPNDQERVEHQVLELAGPVIEEVEQQESVPAENQLDQEQNLSQQDSPYTFVENRDQELNSGSFTSCNDQTMNGSSSTLDNIQKMNVGRSSSNEDPIEEQVQKGGLADLEETMERLEVQYDIQVPPISGVKVQENMSDQIDGEILDIKEEEFLREEIVHQERNGDPGSGVAPADRQEKVQIFAEAQDEVQVQVEENAITSIVQDEKDNLEDVVHEEQVVPAVECARALEVQDNVVKEDKVEVIFNPFIARHSFYEKRLYAWRIKDDGF